MRDPAWRMTGVQLRRLRVYLDCLPASGVTVWPSPTDLLVNGMKVYQYRQIWVAAFALRQASPALAVIRSRQALVHLVEQYRGQDSRWACIKRERSKEGQHAFFPEGSDKARAEHGLTKLCHLLKEEDNSFRTPDARAFGLRPPQWFVQPYIPQLRFLGEIRVVCINGIIAARQYTTPVTVEDIQGVSIDHGFTTHVDVHVPDSTHIRQLSHATRTTITALTLLLRYDHTRPPTTWLADNDHDPSQLTAEFDKWVLQTLEKLIIIEEDESELTSSLRVFVRLDVSVFYDARTRTHRWFVNEVTRSHDTCLWLQVLDEHNRLEALNAIVNRLNEAFYHAVSTRLLCKGPP